MITTFKFPLNYAVATTTSKYAITITSKFLLFVFLILFSSMNSHAIFGGPENVANSYYQWKNTPSGDRLLSCMTSRLDLDDSDYNNTFIPPTISRDMTINAIMSQGLAVFVADVLLDLGKAAAKKLAKKLATKMAQKFSQKIASYASSGVGYAALAAELAIFYLACDQFFIVAPHEVYNIKEGLTAYKLTTENYKNTHPDQVGVDQIPFYYHCDPTWEPSQYGNADNNASNQRGKVIDYVGASATEKYKHYHTWGYMDEESPYCEGRRGVLGKTGWMKDNTGTIAVRFKNFSSTYDSTLDGDVISTTSGISFFKAGQRIFKAPILLIAYYKYVNAKFMICISSPFTFLPVRVGCAHVAPPGEGADYFPDRDRPLEGTRCVYLIKGREDLKGFATSLGAAPHDSRNYSVKRFLASSFHPVSTMVGCMQDMLSSAFLKESAGSGKSLLGQIQENLRGVMAAAVALSIALFSMKALAKGESVQASEVWEYILRIVLVVSFGMSPLMWKDPGAGEKSLAGLVWSMPDLIAGTLVSASADKFDPIGFCHHDYGGQNLLTTREITGTGFDTSGQNHLQMSFLDYIDCKIINYLNFSSCVYGPSGMISVLMMITSVMVIGYGIFVALAMAIYVAILFKVMLQICYTFVLSLCALAILILLSPIFILMALFDATYNIFSSWLNKVLVYSIYPGMLISIIVIFFSIFDSMYYGHSSTQGGSIFGGADYSQPINTGSLLQTCDDNESIFCIGVKLRNDPTAHPCDITSSNEVASRYLEMKGFMGINYVVTRVDVITQFFAVFIKIALFSIIFSMIIDKLIELLDTIFVVDGNLSNITQSAMAYTVGQATSRLKGRARQGAAKYLNKAMTTKKEKQEAAKAVTKAKMKELKEEGKGLSEKKSALEERIDSLKERENKVGKKHAEAEKKGEDLKKDLKELESKRSAAKTPQEKKELDKEIKEKKKEINQNNKEKNEADHELQYLAKNLDSAQEELMETDHQLKENRLSMAVLTEQSSPRTSATAKTEAKKLSVVNPRTVITRGDNEN